MTASTPQADVDGSAIDAMRAIAAVTVVWGHVWTRMNGEFVPGIGAFWHLLYSIGGLRHEAVLAFFVISGYWIGRTVLRRIDRGSWGWPEYIVDRLTRLMIVLVPALIIGGGLDYLGRYVFEFSIYAALPGFSGGYADVGDQLHFANVVSSLFFLTDVWKPALGSNGPLWSLTCEFWYYLWFPLAVTAFSRGRIAVVPLILLALTVFFVRGPLYYLPCWLVGVAAYLAETRLAPPSRALPLSFAAGILALVGATTVVSHSEFLPMWLSSLIFAASVGVLITFILRYRIGWPPTLTAIARFGARSSYSLYVIHYPLTLMAKAVIDPSQRMVPSVISFGICLALTGLFIVIAGGFSLLTEAQTVRIRDVIRQVLADRRTARG